MRPVFCASIPRVRAVPAIGLARNVTLRYENDHIIVNGGLADTIFPSQEIDSKRATSMQKDHKFALDGSACACVGVVEPASRSHSGRPQLVILNELVLIDLKESAFRGVIFGFTVQLAESANQSSVDMI